MDKVRIGIVGSKFAADFHADSYRRCPGAEIAAVAAIDNLEEYARKWNVPKTYEDYKEMIAKEEIDVVDVCVPNFLHHDVAVAAAAAGKHVITEKPLATTVKDAREVVEACKKNKVILCYAEDWVFAPALVRAEEIIREGGMGKVFWIKAKECHNGSHSKFAQLKQYCGGGSLMHLGIHSIGWLRAFLGQKVVEVTGKVTGGGDKNFHHKNYTGEDWGCAILKFEDGTRAFIEGNYITVGGMQDTIEIYGETGCMHIDVTHSSPIRAYSQKGYGYAIEKTDFTHGWTRPAVDEFRNLGYVEELAYFIECLRKKQPPRFGVRAEDGAACVEVINAIYESAEKGKSITGLW